MATAWASVSKYEHDHGVRFDAIVFSRPDIAYFAPMGPWCEYNLTTTWYAPWGGNTPDMLWMLPRKMARHVLTTFTAVVVPCASTSTAHVGRDRARATRHHMRD